MVIEAFYQLEKLFTDRKKNKKNIKDTRAGPLIRHTFPLSNKKYNYGE